MVNSKLVSIIEVVEVVQTRNNSDAHRAFKIQQIIEIKKVFYFFFGGGGFLGGYIKFKVHDCADGFFL